MTIGIGCELSFGQLKYGMPFILQSKFALNFLKNSVSVIINDNFCCSCGFHKSDTCICAGGVINCVIEHLRKSVLPYTPYIIRKPNKKGGNMNSPDNILFYGFGQRKYLLPFCQWMQ